MSYVDPITVDDPEDPRLDDYRNLTDMDLRLRVEAPAGMFIAEGYLVLEKVVELGLCCRSVLVEPKRVARLTEILTAHPRAADIPIYCAPATVLQALTGYRVHRGVLACVDRPTPLSVNEVMERSGDLLILEGLVDPTNVGLAMRSATALGIAAAVVSPDCADPLYRRAVRTSMGATLVLPWARSTAWPQDLDLIRDRGYDLMALSPDPDGVDLETAVARAREDGRQVAAVFGTEGDGLRAETMQLIARSVRIDMASGIDSLNVAAAVAVVAYALR